MSAIAFGMHDERNPCMINTNNGAPLLPSSESRLASSYCDWSRLTPAVAEGAQMHQHHSTGQQQSDHGRVPTPDGDGSQRELMVSVHAVLFVSYQRDLLKHHLGGGSAWTHGLHLQKSLLANVMCKAR